MYQKSFVASVLLAALSVAQEEDGPQKIIVALDDKRETLYVHATSWSDIEADKMNLDVLGGSRMTFSWSPTSEPESVFKPDLLGGFVKFDVDLSKIGCNCVANFAGFTMPAVDNLEDAYKKCYKGGTSCPSFNIMSANLYGFTSNQKRCFDTDSDGIYDYCDDDNGCRVHAYRDTRFDNPYGPGEEYRIDTTKPFRVRTDLQEGGDGLWTAMRTVFAQKKGNKWQHIWMTRGDCPYLQSSSQEVQDGLAFVLQTYRQDDSWLNRGMCDTPCESEDMLAAFTNFRFYTKGAAKAPLDWTKYTYGEFCDDDDQENEANECEKNTGECRWSYPSHDDDEWNSEDVACRTMPKQRAPEGYDYDDETCEDDEPSHCGGCDQEKCKWSWPKEDPLTWRSQEAFCRCKPDVTYVYTDAHGPGTNNYIGECGADCGTCQWSWPEGDEDKHASQHAAYRCKPETIKEVVFGQKCKKVNDGKCGNYCKDCNWSWYADDIDFNYGESAACRCKTWWGID